MYKLGRRLIRRPLRGVKFNKSKHGIFGTCQHEAQCDRCISYDKYILISQFYLSETENVGACLPARNRKFSFICTDNATHQSGTSLSTTSNTSAVCNLTLTAPHPSLSTGPASNGCHKLPFSLRFHDETKSYHLSMYIYICV